jgi:trk system potassium uptake protein TrkA
MHIIIIGCGRLGAGLAQTLSLMQHTVTVIDKDPQAFERLGPRFTGRKVPGVGFDQQVLRQAGIERADGLAAVTSSDEANVVAARIAREIYRVPKVVARLYEPGQGEIYERLGLQTVAPVSWGINYIAELLSYTELERVASLGTADVELVAVEAPVLLAGKTVAALSMPGELSVVAITRGGRSFLPTRATEFRSGDLVHLAVLAASASRLEHLLRGEAGG